MATIRNMDSTAAVRNSCLIKNLKNGYLFYKLEAHKRGAIRKNGFADPEDGHQRIIIGEMATGIVRFTR